MGSEEELTRQSLYQYLNYVKLAVRIANDKLDLESLDQEIIARYGLAPKPEVN